MNIGRYLEFRIWLLTIPADFTIALLGAGLIGLSLVLPTPLRLLAALIAISIPGWSLMRLVFARGASDYLTGAVTSVTSSVVVLIGSCLLLDLIGIRITWIAIAVVVIAFQIVTALLILIRTNLQSGRRPLDVPSVSALSSPFEASSAPWRAAQPWIAAFVSFGVALALVSLVYSLKPKRLEPNYDAVAFSGDLGAARNVVPVSPGPLMIGISVDGSRRVSGSILVKLDSKTIGSATVAESSVPATMHLVVQMPRLNRCRHQLAVSFQTSYSAALEVTRYVVGDAGNQCASGHSY